jgi:hypothetical protein
MTELRRCYIKVLPNKTFVRCTHFMVQIFNGKLTVSLQTKTFPSFFTTWRLTAVLTRVHHWSCSERVCRHLRCNVSTRWFKYDRDDLCVNKSQFVPVIFEPPCINELQDQLIWVQVSDKYHVLALEKFCICTFPSPGM